MPRQLVIVMVALPLAVSRRKRPVTLDDVTATRSPRSGSGAILWAPRGNRFAFREGNSIWQYAVQSKLKKEIVSLVPLREKAVKPPAADAFDWQNRRVAESSYSGRAPAPKCWWTRTADLFLVQVDSGEWKQ